MTINGWLQILFFLLIVLALTKPLGVFMARVFNRERTFMDPTTAEGDEERQRLELVGVALDSAEEQSDAVLGVTVLGIL